MAAVPHPVPLYLLYVLFGTNILHRVVGGGVFRQLVYFLLGSEYTKLI